MIDNLSCSLGFEFGGKGISSVIVFFQRLGDRPNRWNPFKLGEAKHHHVLGFKNKQTIIETHMMQGTRIKPIEVYKGKKFEVYKPLFLDDTTKGNMLQLLDFTVGERYGWAKLPLMALDSTFKTYWFTKKASLTHFKVCSQVWSWAYQKTPKVVTQPLTLDEIARGKYTHNDELNYKFGSHWKQTTPDSMYDHVSGAVTQWEKIK